MPHVTFSNDVSKIDGHAITIEEHHPIANNCTSSSNPFAGRFIGVGCHNGVVSDGSISDSRSRNNICNSQVDMESFGVKMGILKCGHRYRLSVPICDATSPRHQNMNARIIEIDDDDLRGEIENNTHVNIFLSARLRGPFRGRLLIELTQLDANIEQTTNTEALNNESVNIRHLSVQIEASIMGKGMGTPQLRNGVTCLGKLVGYDSDEETEWQGFD